MPVTKFSTPEKYRYQNGFSSCHETEAIPGALPIGANSPQKPPLGLYAEKLSGTAFTAPRHQNLQTWLYRILPSAAHTPFRPVSSTASFFSPSKTHSPEDKIHYIPNQLRWSPFSLTPSSTEEPLTWPFSFHNLAAIGSPALKSGLSISIFTPTASMQPHTSYSSSDGDLLIVPQSGPLDIQTELGHLLVRPLEIAVLPRGIKYRVLLPEGPVRGYALELWEGHFRLPELGPLGSSGLAAERDWQVPVAAFDDDEEEEVLAGNGPSEVQKEPKEWTILNKFNSTLFTATQPHSPFNVLAWHGTYYPVKYDLGRFSPIGALLFDHPDPSIFTVLSAPSSMPGTSVADFVIFPPRWLVGENTFRPPWFHRNTMSEFMGLIGGEYDAKSGSGFAPGGASLHNVMSGHGPDAETYERERVREEKPVKVGMGSMAFMFESCLMLGVTEWGLHSCEKVQEDYNEESWMGLKVHFKKPKGFTAKSHLLQHSDDTVERKAD